MSEQYDEIEDDPAFLAILSRHLGDFEEARELYQENADMGGAMFDDLMSRLDLSDRMQQYAEAYLEGRYDPLA